MKFNKRIKLFKTYKVQQSYYGCETCLSEQETCRKHLKHDTNRQVCVHVQMLSPDVIGDVMTATPDSMLP